jgi:hypothetical protein
MPTILRTTVIVFALALGACAAPRQYDWNQYDQRLYDYYKDPAASTEFVKSMEAHLKAVEASGRKPAPGLYAEVGTFYLKQGDMKTAIQYYNKEMTAWPESKGLMTALIASADKVRTGGVK